MLLSTDGRNLYYDLVGPASGPVVCFTHSLAADSGMWAEQVPALVGAGFRVLRLDMRGHGGIDAVPGEYTMEELADDVAAVIASLEIGQVHYVGLSIGGMFGQAFTLGHADRIRSLVLCDTHPASAPNAKELWAPRIAAVKQANSLLPIADATMERWLTQQYKKANPGRWKQIRDTVAATTPQGYCGCVAAIQNFDFRAQLPSIKSPALVVCGADDPGAPPEESRQIAGLLPNARYEEIADARHLPNVEHPGVFNRLLRDWLKSRR
ncbi:MAG: alpha/beta fold hydrolase [Desulfobacterales bacterium]|nr:alpha/beta fold hydrolase [Desulfobacterales bacterium]